MTLKNIYLGLTLDPISQIFFRERCLPLMSRLLSAFSAAKPCVAVTGWQIGDRLSSCSTCYPSKSLPHALITVCKGCGSVCQRSNTLPLIAVKWTSSDVCRSWHSKSFLPPFRHSSLTPVSMLWRKISDEFWLRPQRDMEIWSKGVFLVYKK